MLLATVEAEILWQRKLGPARGAAQVGRPTPTVHRVLVRHVPHRLATVSLPSGRPIRRYEHIRPASWSTST